MPTILAVDDERTLLDILCLVLEKEGYRVVTAGDGLEALNAVYQERPELVLLDDMLPGLSGADICSKIKNDPQMSDTQIILYSAGPRVRDANFIQHIGANAAICKPFKPSEMVRAVKNCLKPKL